jgi:hypothetical protein
MLMVVSGGWLRMWLERGCCGWDVEAVDGCSKDVVDKKKNG